MKILFKRFPAFILLLVLLTSIIAVDVPVNFTKDLTADSATYSPYDYFQTTAFQPLRTTAPSSFKGVSYKPKAGVIMASGKLTDVLKDARMGDELKSSTPSNVLTPEEKLARNTFVTSKNMATKFPGYKKGSILLDETTGIAAKVADEVKADGNITENSVVLARPQIHEVLDDINIPQQTISLNTGNIGSMPAGVKQSIVADSSTPHLTFLSTAEYGKHLSDPLVEFEFSNIPLVAYSSDGISILVNLNGYIGIDSIQVQGHYSFMGGYEFVATTGEEIDLKVTSAMTINKEMIIPLFGIDIPAGIAHASGGLFLVVGMNGNFTLVTEAEQWLTVKAGIEGGTFLGVPTGFNPVFQPVDKGFEVDVAFNGSVNGYIKAGPMVQLQLFGWDVAGAGVLGGAGIECTVDNSMISADVYASMEVYALLLGTRLNLLNSRLVLLQLRIPDTKGYSIQYYEADAFQGTVWGKIMKDYGGTTGLKPFEGDLVLQVKRNGVEMGKHNAHSDSNGIFSVLDLNSKEKLYKGDEIKVIKVSGADINSGSITPTLPFNLADVEYADFFNDAARGHIATAVVKNWATGVKKEINYNGMVGFTVINDASQGGGTYDISPVTSDGNGKFSVNYDFKPKQKLKAKLLYNGFVVESKEEPTSVDIIAQRVIEDKGKSEYADNGRVIEKRTEQEYFMIFNLRGTKQINQQGVYTGTYKLFDGHNIIVDPKTGQPLLLAKTLGEKVFTRNVTPQGLGASMTTSGFITEWGWKAKPKRVAGLATPSIVRLPLVTGDNAYFRYESDMYKEDYDAISSSLDRPTAGIDAVRKTGVLTIVYEGASIDIKDPSDTPKLGKGSKTITTTDPFARSITQRYWDRVINPMDTYNPGIDSLSLVNASQLASWSRNPASSMISKGIMIADKQGRLKSNTAIPRGEFAAFLTRALKLQPALANTVFTDISAFYPYTYEINTAVKYGLMSGAGSNKFNPFGTLTREQAAVITMNAMKKVLSGKLSIPSSSRNVTFNDIKSISSTNLTAVRELSSLGLMYKRSDGKFMPKSALTYEDTAYLLDKVNQKALK